MNARQDPIENLLRQHLQPVDLPPASFIWSAVRPRLGSTKRGAPITQVALGLALLIALSASLALASPDVRTWLGNVGVSMSGSGGRVDSLYPAPPFAVLQPTAVPQGWTLLANGYYPGPTPNGTPSWSTSGGAVARRSGGQELTRQLSEQAQARAQDLLAGGEAPVGLASAAPDGRPPQIRDR